jgi:ketosteroid isomerase-like protein
LDHGNSFQTRNDNEIIVKEYFSKVNSKDIDGLLELFSDDSVIYEPFSRSERLSGKSAIEPFLKSVIMANEGLQYELEFARQENKQNNDIVALVTFRKENEINSRLTFGFENSHNSKFKRRIKSLLIEFTD